MKILLSTFHTPGIRALEYLFQAGIQPGDIRVLTHDLDKNRFLLDYLALECIEFCTSPAKSDEAYEWIRSFGPDVLFSLYFRDLIPQRVLELPPLGAVNLHPALLPKYRGTFSAPWVIINGEPFTGFTYHYMHSKFDAGRIVLQRQVAIRPDETAFSLYHKLLTEGMAAFPEAFHRVVVEHTLGDPQVGEPSYYPRKVPFGGYIDPAWPREQIDRYIRAMYFPPLKGALLRLADGEQREINSLAEYDALVAAGCVPSAA